MENIGEIYLEIHCKMYFCWSFDYIFQTVLHGLSTATGHWKLLGLSVSIST